MMDVIGQFEPGDSQEDEIPRYNQRGRLLSEEERQKIADRLGVCLRCNVRLSVKRGILSKRPLTNDNVYQGICIRCNPRKVPANIFQAWDKRNRPLRNARVTHANNYTRTGSERDDSQRSVSPRHIVQQASPNPRSQRQINNARQQPRNASPRQRIRPVSTTRTTNSNTAANGESDRLRFQQQRRQNASAPRPSQANTTTTVSPILLRNNNSSTLTPSSHHSSSHHSTTTMSPRRAPPLPFNRLEEQERAPRIVQASAHANVSSTFTNSEESDSEAWDTSLESFQNTSHAFRSFNPVKPDEWRGDAEPKPVATYLQELGENLNDPATLRSILHNLRNMEANQETGLALFQTKEIIVHCIDNARVADVAVGVFWRAAAVDAEAKKQVMESGVVSIAFECLQRHRDDVELSMWALGFLASITILTDNKEQIVDQGGLTLILDHLSVHGDNARILEWGSRCLYNLVFDCSHSDADDTTATSTKEAIITKHIKLIQQSDPINIIVGSMKLHSTSDVANLWSIKLLWRLMASDEGVSRQRRRRSILQRITVIHNLVKADYIAVATNILRSSNSSYLHLLTAELLAMVILGSFGESDMLRRALLVEYASQCAPIIIQKMEEMPEDQSIQKAGCALISALCTIEGDMPQFLIESKAVDSILSTLVLLENEVDVVSAGTWALWKLSSAWKTSSEPIKWDITQIICALGISATVAARHPKERDVLQAFNGFVQNIAGAPGLEFGDFPVSNVVKGIYVDSSAGGVEALISLCHYFPESSWTLVQKLGVPSVLDAFNTADSIVLDPVIKILLAATEKCSEASDELVKTGIITACVSALDRSLGRDEVVSIATLMIALLSPSSRSSSDSAQPKVPHGFYGAILKKLKQHRSDDEDLCISLLRAATDHLSKIHPSAESLALLPWLVDGLLDKSLCRDLRMCIGRAIWAIGTTRIITDSGQLKTLVAAVLTYMSEFDGSGDRPIDIETEEVAAGALHGISVCMKENIIDLDTSQVNTAFQATYKMMPLSIQGEAFMIYMISAALNLFKVHQQQLLDSGLIVVVMDVMAAFRESEIVQERCCAILAQMTGSENIQILLTVCEMDGINFLLEALAAFPRNKEIQSEASKAIAHLSTNPEVRGLLCALGGIDALLQAISSFHEDATLVERAYSALLNLTSDAPEFLIDCSAVVQTIVDTLSSHPASGSLLKNGLGILQNVCMKGPEAKEIIASKGGIATVLTAMEDHMIVPTVMKRSFSTLWSLAVLPANQRRIAEANGLSIVVTGMLASISHERVQQQGCGCIYTLALDPENRASLRKLGAPTALVLAAQAHSSSLNVQTEVSKTLSCLSTSGESDQGVESVSTEEVATVLQAMNRFPKDESVQVNGSQALVNFLQAGNAASLVAAHRSLLKRAVHEASAAFPTQCASTSNDFELLLSQY